MHHASRELQMCRTRHLKRACRTTLTAPWRRVANLSGAAVPVPAGEVLLASGDLTDGRLPADTAVWLR